MKLSVRKEGAKETFIEADTLCCLFLLLVSSFFSFILSFIFEREKRFEERRLFSHRIRVIQINYANKVTTHTLLCNRMTKHRSKEGEKKERRRETVQERRNERTEKEKERGRMLGGDESNDRMLLLPQHPFLFLFLSFSSPSLILQVHEILSMKKRVRQREEEDDWKVGKDGRRKRGESGLFLRHGQGEGMEKDAGH